MGLISPDLILAMYSVNSRLTTGAKKYKPIKLGIDIAKIMASVKLMTTLKFIDEPITTKTKNTVLYVMS